jgi:hypothetical protein
MEKIKDFDSKKTMPPMQGKQLTGCCDVVPQSLPSLGLTQGAKASHLFYI